MRPALRAFAVCFGLIAQTFGQGTLTVEELKDAKALDDDLAKQCRVGGDQCAQANAGLTRSVVAAAAGLVIWLAVGTALVRWYDRKGLSRIDPQLLEYVGRAAQQYKSRNTGGHDQDSPAHPDEPGPQAG